MKRSGSLAAAACGYLALLCLALHRLLAHLPSHILTADSLTRSRAGETYTTAWIYWWFQHQLGRGANPFYCGSVLPPIGALYSFDTQRLLTTALTSPLRLFLNPIAAYNFMVLGLLLGGGVACFAFFSRGLKLGWSASFLGGLLFGLSPYFVFQAHLHPNLVGEVFWAGALAVLVWTYTEGRLSPRSGSAFSLLVWCTFWQSLVEFYMLAVAAALAVVVLEFVSPAVARVGMRARLAFFAPLAAGLPSLLFVWTSPMLRGVSVGTFNPGPELHWADLLAPPALGILGGPGAARAPEFWGTALPVMALVLAAWAAVSLKGPRRHLALAGWVLALALAMIAVNFGGVPRGLLDLLPWGRQFRVPGRFFPFALFFMCIPAAMGADDLIRRARRHAAPAAALLVLLASIEYAPIRSVPGGVASMPRLRTLDATEDSARVLVVPRDEYTNWHDTYQIALDAPVVYSSYMSMGGRELARALELSYPRIYKDGSRVWDADWGQEIARLHVTHFLIEDSADVRRLPPALREHPVYADGSVTLIRLPGRH